MKAKLLMCLLMLTTAGCTYSTGDRAGTVAKLSEKGVICSSWEGELLVGPNQVWAFSVTDVELLDELKAAMSSGGRVTLHYDQKLFVVPCTTKTDYVVTGVTVD